MKNTFTHRFARLRRFIGAHKKASIAIGIAALLIGYFGIKALTNTSADAMYVLDTVTRGTVVSSISGSGQVSTDRELDLKPNASGTVIYVGRSAGDVLKEGDLIVELDPSTAQKAVRDAELNLQSAQLALQKLERPADSLSLLQAQNSLEQSKTDLAKSYDDGFTDVSNAFLDLPSVISGIDTILHGTDANSSTNGQSNLAYYGDSAAQFETTAATGGKAFSYRDDAEAKYHAAKTAYDKNFSDYKNTTRSSDTATVDALIQETYTTAKLISDATKSAQNLIQYYQDTLTAAGKTPIARSTTHLATLSGYTGKIGTHVSTLLSIKNTISQDAMAIPEKSASLEKIQGGTDTLDLQSAQLTVTSRQNALEDAKDALADYFVRAPFAGTLAKLSVKRGDPASSGTAVATMIAQAQVADIALNEVDAAKIKLGDKTTLTFDAIDGLTLTGKIAAIDSVGTVSQGVVTYNVTISFDSSDERVKPGMSVSASIMTDAHQDVLLVPSSAVKSSGGASFVEVFDTPPAGAANAGNAGVTSSTPPRQVVVETGLSDDSSTEIISGLTEGQTVVTRTLTNSSTKTPSSAAPSLFGAGTRTGGTTTNRAIRIGG